MRRLVLGTALIALCASGVAAGPKWVPLDSKQSKVVQGQIPPTAPTAPAPVAMQKVAAPPAPTVVVAPAPPQPVAPQPVAAQSTPTDLPAGTTVVTNHPMEITCFGGGTANKAAAATG